MLLSNKEDEVPKDISKSRGSVPIITTLPRLLTRSKNDGNAHSLPGSPNSPKRSKKNPLKFMRKHTENSVVESPNESECWSPKTKRVFESTSTEETTAECTSFKAMTISE